jgi:hypothetical protein
VSKPPKSAIGLVERKGNRVLDAVYLPGIKAEVNVNSGGAGRYVERERNIALVVHQR